MTSNNLLIVSYYVALYMTHTHIHTHIYRFHKIVIVYSRISFISRSKRMDIILRVTTKVKQFDKLTSNDINVYCVLGTVK